MKKILSSLSLLTVVLLTGCSSPPNNNATEDTVASNPTVSTQKGSTVDKTNASSVAQDLVQKLFDNGSNAHTSLSIAGKNATDIVGKEHYSVLQQTQKSQEDLRKMPTNVVKKLLQNYTDYDTMSLYYDTSNTDEADQTIMSMYMLATTSMFGTIQEPVHSISLDNDAVIVNNDHATVDLGKIKYTTDSGNEKSLPSKGTSAPQKLYLIQSKDKTWRIDVHAMVQQMGGSNNPELKSSTL